MMKQYRITAGNFAASPVPDAVMDTSDLQQLKTLAGIASPINENELAGSNISVTGMEKAELQKKNDIRPGTPEWFQLWFSRPYLTGEKPLG